MLPADAHRRRAGLWSCGLLLAAALGLEACRQLDLRPMELLRALTLAGLGVVPCGLLLTAGALRGALGRLERLALALLVGYPVACAGFYLLCRVGASRATPAVAVGLAALAVRSEWRQASRALGSARWIWTPLLAPLVAAALLLTTHGNRAFTPYPGGRFYDHSLDHAANLAIYWELLRGVPPTELPYAAGLPFPHRPYHVLGYMLGTAIARWAGVGVVTLHHAFIPLWHLSLLALGLLLAARFRTGSPLLATVVLVGAFFLDAPLELAYSRRILFCETPLPFALTSASAGGGFAVWAGVLALLALADRLHAQQPVAARRAAWLAALAAGVAYLFKAQFFLLLGPAFVIAALLVAARDRRADLLAAAALCAAVAALLHLSWPGPAAAPTVQVAAGAFARAFVLPALASDPSRLVREGVLGTLQHLPAPLAVASATTLGVWRVAHLSPLVPAWIAWRLRGWRSAACLDALIVIAFPVAWSMAIALVGLEYPGRPFSPHLAREALPPLAFVAVAIDVATAGAALRRAGRHQGLLLGLVAGLALLVLPRTRSQVEAASPAFRLSDGAVGALSYLREHTPLDAVVASPQAALSEKFPRRMAVVSGLAGRRAVREYGPFDLENDREGDIERLYSTPRLAVARRILERYRVSYVLESAALPLRFPTGGLRLAFDGGDTRVYQVAGRAGSAAHPPFAVPDLR